MILFSKKRLLSLGSSARAIIPSDSAIGLVETLTARVRTAAAIYEGFMQRYTWVRRIILQNVCASKLSV